MREGEGREWGGGKGGEECCRQAIIRVVGRPFEGKDVSESPRRCEERAEWDGVLGEGQGSGVGDRVGEGGKVGVWV